MMAIEEGVNQGHAVGNYVVDRLQTMKPSPHQINLWRKRG